MKLVTKVWLTCCLDSSLLKFAQFLVLVVSWVDFCVCFNCDHFRGVLWSYFGFLLDRVFFGFHLESDFGFE